MSFHWQDRVRAGFPGSLLPAVLFLGLFATVPAAVAQTPTTNELSQYTNAVAHVQAADRLAQLEHFAFQAQPGPLKVDALQFVIWEYLRIHDRPHALMWANQLASTDKDNSVALALLSDEMRNASLKTDTEAEQLLTMANHGLDSMSQLRRPLGMNPGDFDQLKRDAAVMLNGAAGWAELQTKNYAAARNYLSNAVAMEPANSRDVYALGLADLGGPNPNRKEGYLNLAQAVNLSRGTPQSEEIERFARARYLKDGGSVSDWNQFLAATSNAKQTPSPVIASASPPPPAAVAPDHKAPPAMKATKTSTTAPPIGSKPAPSVWTEADTGANAPVVRKRTVSSTTGPMSLGILVETSLTNKENRSAVVSSLIDMLRRMSDNDQAFILAYDNNLVFEQDLTNDPQQLEEAMESIKPQKGTVLDDAIAFAAGHLARIAKYPNRVLLVISDGRNLDSHASPIETSAEINAAGVRIYCIGVDVDGADGRYRLQALSSSTGGQSSFINDPGQFRNATKEIARNMGIDFRF